MGNGAFANRLQVTAPILDSTRNWHQATPKGMGKIVPNHSRTAALSEGDRCHRGEPQCYLHYLFASPRPCGREKFHLNASPSGRPWSRSRFLSCSFR
jgi:hypothetical protein